jgi:hypothetical protein
MRPRKKVVLLAHDDEQMSLWKLRIYLAGYDVIPIATVEAAEFLTPDIFCAVLIDGTTRDCAFLSCFPEVKVLAIGGNLQTDAFTDARVAWGNEIAWRGLAALRILTNRKRGPKYATSGTAAKAAA